MRCDLCKAISIVLTNGVCPGCISRLIVEAHAAQRETINETACRAGVCGHKEHPRSPFDVGWPGLGLPDGHSKAALDVTSEPGV